MLLTASRYARDPRVTGGLPVIDVPRRLGHDRAAFRRWLAGTLRELAPDELIVDSFPGGILGELCGLELPPARLIARRLRWPAYRGRLRAPLPRYETRARDRAAVRSVPGCARVVRVARRTTVTRAGVARDG